MSSSIYNYNYNYNYNNNNDDADDDDNNNNNNSNNESHEALNFGLDLKNLISAAESWLKLDARARVGAQI